MKHHTKDKGDQGLGFVIASLLAQNVQVALPLSEHLPFDCIAIHGNKLSRISVKYRTKSEGSIAVRLRSTWADRHGSHVRKHDKKTYDAIAVYCPDTGQCYFIRNNEVRSETVTLRIDETRNGKKKGIRWAKDHQDPKRLF